VGAWSGLDRNKVHTIVGPVSELQRDWEDEFVAVRQSSGEKKKRKREKKKRRMKDSLLCRRERTNEAQIASFRN